MHLFYLITTLALGLASATHTVVTKQFIAGDGTKYTYDHAPAATGQSTFLLLHGFPSGRQDWRYQVAHLTSQGYGVVVPDCLGYGGTDQPTEVEAYRMKTISQHLADILDHESLEKVIGVGHDWGSLVLSAAAVWHPSRFAKLAFVSVPYAPPREFLDLDAINLQTFRTLGYTTLGYWYFFNSWDSAGIIKDNLASAFSLFYLANNSALGISLGQLGAARTWLTTNTTTPLPTWLSASDRTDWMAQFGQKNATTASLNYYKAAMRGVQVADTQHLSDEAMKLRVPVLGIGGALDQLARASQMGEAIQPWVVAGYKEEVVEAGHWVMLEKRNEVSRILAEFGRS